MAKEVSGIPTIPTFGIQPDIAKCGQEHDNCKCDARCHSSCDTLCNLTAWIHQRTASLADDSLVRLHDYRRQRVLFGDDDPGKDVGDEAGEES